MERLVDSVAIFTMAEVGMKVAFCLLNLLQRSLEVNLFFFVLIVSGFSIALIGLHREHWLHSRRR